MIDFRRLGRLVLQAERQGTAMARTRLLERLAGLLAHPQVSRPCLLASLDAAIGPARPGEDPEALGRRLFAHFAGAPARYGGVWAFDPLAAAAEAARLEAEAAAAQAGARELALPLPARLQATAAGRRIRGALARFGRALESGLPEVAFLGAVAALEAVLAPPGRPARAGRRAGRDPGLRAGALLGDRRRTRGEWLRLCAWRAALVRGGDGALVQQAGPAPAVPLLRAVLGALLVDPSYLLLDSEDEVEAWWDRLTAALPGAP